MTTEAKTIHFDDKTLKYFAEHDENVMVQSLSKELIDARSKIEELKKYQLSLMQQIMDERNKEIEVI